MSLKQIISEYYSLLPPYVRHLKGCYYKVHSFYKDAQWWSKQKIDEWQLARMKFIVNYAYNNTSGYHQLYDEAGIKPSDILCLEDIQHLPFTTKQLLRENIKVFTASSNVAGRLHQGSTGGSSGEPFMFYADVANMDAEYAFIYSAWESIGWKETDKGIVLRGKFQGGADNVIKKIGYKLYALSSNYLTDVNYYKYISAIKECKATWIHAYPSTLTDLSNMIITHGDEGIYKFSQIFLGSENLYNWQKEIIQKAFPSAKIMSWYGHSERAIWAPYCEGEQKYHVCPFYGYTEILDGIRLVNEGEVGELVGTSFWMLGTPFIRYRTNDYAEKGPSKCEKCGRNFQLINSIDGRLSEIIIGKDGRRISLTVFAGSVMHGNTFEHIKQFRFVQEKMGHLTLCVVPGRDFSQEQVQILKNKLTHFLGDDFVCDVIIVEQLAASKRGKYSYLDQRMNVLRSDTENY